MLARDAAVLAAGNAVTPQPAGIEPFTHRTGCDLTDFRHLAGGKNFLHGRHSNLCFLSPLPGSGRGHAVRGTICPARLASPAACLLRECRGTRPGVSTGALGGQALPKGQTSFAPRRTASPGAWE